MTKRLAFLFALLATGAHAQQPRVPISALPPAVTPLVGTETVPVVQNGQTRRALVSDLFGSTSVTTFGRTATPNTWALTQTFSVAPQFPSLVGYMKANAGTGVTASPTVPTTDLAGVLQGAQFAGAAIGGAAITGSTVDGTPIGGTTPAAGSFTTAGATTAALGSLSVTNAPVFTALSGILRGNGAGAVTALGSTGTGNVVLANSPALVTPALGTPASGNLASTTGFPAANLGGTTLPAAVVNSSLKTLGTVTTGTWNGTRIDFPYQVQAPAGTLRGNLTGATADVADSTLSAHLKAAFGAVRGTTVAMGATDYVARTPTAAGQVLTFDGTDTNFATPGAATTLFPGLLFGVTLANNGTSSVDVAAGTAASSDATVRMTLAATLTKSIASTWAAGSGSGGLDTGAAAASTWYHVLLIYNPTTLATDALLSLSATAPTLPSGYTKFRRIGSVLTTATATTLTAFTQVGDEFILSAAVQNVSAGTLAVNASATQALTAPLGVRTKARISVNSTSATINGQLVVTPLDKTAPTVANSEFATRSPVASQLAAASFDVQTDTASSVRLTALVAALSAYNVFTSGWIDTRGK